jgi:hypothetical protein
MAPGARRRARDDPSILCFLTPLQGFTLTRELQPNGLHPLEIELANACVVRLTGAVDPELLRIAIRSAARLGGDGRGGD